MAKQNGRTPDWMIERLALGELDPATAAGVRQRLVDEGRSPEAEIAALAVSNREILADHPAAGIAAAVNGRLASAGTRNRAGGRRPLWLFAGGPLALAGAAALLLIVGRQPPSTTGGDGEKLALEDTGIKGTTSLHVYRHGRQGDERLPDGARAARGDLLQLAYRAGDGARFGVLLSIDGAGHVTMHWPDANAGDAATLSAKGEVRLPAAYELDDAPAFERFFLITAAEPFSTASVVGAARVLAAQPTAARGQRLALPTSLHQESLTVDKSAKENR
jgi:hypothetical protein